MCLRRSDVHGSGPVTRSKLGRKPSTPGLKKAFIPLFQLCLLAILTQRQVDAETSYQPKGVMIRVDQFDVYVYGTGKLPVIALHDNKGIKPTIQMIIDQIADASHGTFKMFMPDFCADVSGKNSPRNGLCYAAKWAGEIQVYFNKILTHFMESENNTRFGVIGFCYSAPWAILASKYFTENVAVIAIVHPYPYFEDTPETLEIKAENVESPILIMPSKDEVDMTPFYAVVKAKFGEDRTLLHPFRNLGHGFAGNYEQSLSDPEVINGRKMVVKLITEFFHQIYYNRSLPIVVKTTTTTEGTMTITMMATMTTMTSVDDKSNNVIQTSTSNAHLRRIHILPQCLGLITICRAFTARQM